MLLLVLAGAFANPIPAGEMLSESLMVDIPPQGFEALEGVIPGLIPSPIEIPEFAEESSTCPTGGYWYKIELKNATAGIEVQNVFLTPQSGYMDMEMDLAINLNDPNDRFKLNYWLVCIKRPCRFCSVISTIACIGPSLYSQISPTNFLLSSAFGCMFTSLFAIYRLFKKN